MIDKIKQYLLTAGGVLVAILAGVIYFLLGKNKSLQSQVGQAKAEKELADVITKKEEAVREANTAEDAYNRIKSEYLKSNSDSSDPKV